MVKKIKERINSSLGAAITILGLFSVMGLLVLGGLIVDANSWASARSLFSGTAASAAKAGIRKQHGGGGLSPEAGRDAVDFYQDRMNNKEFKVYVGGCRGNEYPKITISYLKPGSKSKHISKTVVGKQKLSYTPEEQNRIKKEYFDGLHMEVEDCTRNLFIPGYPTFTVEQKAETIKGAHGK